MRAGMHTSSMKHMEWFAANCFKDVDKEKTLKVFDIGSQCVPEQHDTYRVFFDKPPFQYTGVDMVEGNNVDIVLKTPYKWDEIEDEVCDVLLSGQMFEHVEFPWLTIKEMARIMKRGGIACIIAPSMSGLHRYPVNCQNYFADGLVALCRWAGLEVVHADTYRAPLGASEEWYCSEAQDTMCIAKKPLDWEAEELDIMKYKCIPSDLEKLATGFIPQEKQPWYVQRQTQVAPRPRGVKKILLGIRRRWHGDIERIINRRMDRLETMFTNLTK